MFTQVGPTRPSKIKFTPWLKLKIMMGSQMVRTETLLAIMKKLRDPDGGCPWDIEQTFSTIAPYTIEEAYEVF